MVEPPEVLPGRHESVPPARRVTEPADLAPALREALDHRGPSLVDVVIDGSYGRHF